MTVSQSIFILAALITTAIAAGGAPENFPESVNILQDQTEAISEVNTQQKRMEIPEDAIGETVAQLLEKMNEMQRTMDDHKATIDKLTDSNTALRSSIVELEASKATVTNQMGILQTSMAEFSCAEVRQCLYVSAEEREVLSKALYEAAIHGNAEEIRRLVNAGAHFEYRDKTYDPTALHLAAGYGHVEAVKALIELGAHLEARQDYTESPLYSAIANTREECIELLLLAGASVNVRTKEALTPLHYAASFGTPSIVIKLLDAGADRTAKDLNGNIPKDVTNDADIIALLNNYPLRKT